MWNGWLIIGRLPGPPPRIRILKGFLLFFAEDCVFEDVNFRVIVRGKEELRRFVNGALAAVPDFKYGLRSRFATAQWAVIEWVMSGTHKGDLPGIRATGRRFSSVCGSNILELKAGKNSPRV